MSFRHILQRSTLLELSDDLFSVRGAIMVASWLAAGSAVVFALFIGREYRRTSQYPIPRIELESGVASTDDGRTSLLATYQPILSRNLFQSVAPTSAVTTTATNSPQLKMRLVGTTVVPTGPIAILEDLNKNDQDVFGVGESAFGRAKLVRIENESVVVEFNNRQETLVIEEGLGRGESAGTGGDDQSEFTVAEADLTDALSNLPLLLSQARAVPYFRDGKSIGMRLFAIRKDSMYEKLGLKNGDILLAVNEHNLSDPSQALKIFEQLRSERSIDVKLERNGQPKDLSYSIR